MAVCPACEINKGTESLDEQLQYCEEHNENLEPEEKKQLAADYLGVTKADLNKVTEFR